MTCTSCGAQAAPGARFCHSCGHALEVRADERRIVTVVFADLIGFTAFSEHRDPEQVKNMVDRCFQRLAADVTAFGGRVDKVMGDGLIALFGAPVAHEDDAERAVRAALQMQQSLAQLHSEVQVGMRVGINTGQVLVGSLRAGGDYTAMGDVVNVASRLQTLADAGQVIVGADTFAVTQAVIDYEPLGPVQARGRAEPVDAWVARGTLALPGRRPRREATPLVGRSHEMATLAGALGNAVVRRRPHLTLLLGEAGVGKSRLAEELAREASAVHGALVLEGRCVPYGEANLWWPVAEAIRGACGIEAIDATGEVRAKCRKAVEATKPEGGDEADNERLTAGLLYLLGDEEALADMEPARAEDEALEAVEVLLERLGREKPVVLLLSELHWGDQKVLAAIDAILDRIRSLPLVVLATARGDLLDRWTPAPGRHNILVLHVDSLDAAATEEMLESLTGAALSPALRDDIIARSGGNPFFLEELVTLICDSCGLADGSDLISTANLPATLRGLVAARLDGLDRETRDVLEHAAVFGRSGPTDALTGGRPTTSTDAHLDELASRDLLAVEDDSWSFRNDLVREVAYETLAKSERARRHANIADWLQGRVKELGRDDDGELLAHHAGLAAELVLELGAIEGVAPSIRWTALHALERAAVRAKQRDHHEVALRMLDQAHRLLPPDDEHNMERLLLARAHSRAATRDTAGARADVDAVLAKARGKGDAVAVASALTILGLTQQNEGAFSESAATLGEAIEKWREAEDLGGEANAQRLLGMTRLFSGGADRALEPITLALEAYRATGDKRGQGWALQNLAWIRFSAMDLAGSEGHIAEALDLFRSIHDRAGESYAIGLLGWVRLTQGKMVEAGAIADRILERASFDTSDRWAVAMTMSLQANTRLWLGGAASAVEPARRARDEFVAMGDPLGTLQVQAVLARSLVASGQVDLGLAEMRDAMSQSAPGSYIAPLLSSLPAAIASQIGDVDGARAALSGHLKDDDGILPDDVLAASIDVQSGEAARAVQRLKVVVAKTDNQGTLANAAALLALSHAAAGQPEEASRAALIVAGLDTGTYLDRIQALLGQAFAFAQLGQPADALNALDGAVQAADATTDKVAQAIARLARSHLSPAETHRADAESRLAELGIRAPGWRAVFEAAARHVPAPVPAFGEAQSAISD